MITWRPVVEVWFPTIPSHWGSIPNLSVPQTCTWASMVPKKREIHGNPLHPPWFLGVFIRDWHQHRCPRCPMVSHGPRHWAILSLCFAAFAISGSTALAFWYLWCLADQRREWGGECDQPWMWVSFGGFCINDIFHGGYPMAGFCPWENPHL